MREVPFIGKFGKFPCLIINSVNSQGIHLHLNYITLQWKKVSSYPVFYTVGTRSKFLHHMLNSNTEMTERYGLIGEAKAWGRWGPLEVLPHIWTTNLPNANHNWQPRNVPYNKTVSYIGMKLAKSIINSYWNLALKNFLY